MNCNILRLDGNYVSRALLKVMYASAAAGQTRLVAALAKNGAIAQLVERCDGIAEASGSNPLGSIFFSSLETPYGPQRSSGIFS